MFVLLCAFSAMADNSRNDTVLYRAPWQLEAVITCDTFPSLHTAFSDIFTAPVNANPRLVEQISTGTLPPPSKFDFKKYGCASNPFLFAIYSSPNQTVNHAISLYYPKGYEGEDDRWESIEIYRDCILGSMQCTFCYADSLLQVFYIENDVRALMIGRYKLGRTLSEYQIPYDYRYLFRQESPNHPTAFKERMDSLFRPMEKMPAYVPWYFNSIVTDENFVLKHLFQIQDYQIENRSFDSRWSAIGRFKVSNNEFLILGQSVYPSQLKIYLLANPKEDSLPKGLQIYYGEADCCDTAYFINGNQIYIYLYVYVGDFPMIKVRKYALDADFTPFPLPNYKQ